MGSLALALETPGSDVDLVRFSQTSDWNRKIGTLRSLRPCCFAEVRYTLARTSSRCSDCSEEGRIHPTAGFLLCIGTRTPSLIRSGTYSFPTATWLHKEAVYRLFGLCATSRSMKFLRSLLRIP